jgi:hypothetical protein
VPAGAPSAGAGATARLGAVAFIHRVGAALHAHLHFHCVVIDGVFAPTATGGAVFHPATTLDGPAIATVQAKVRRRRLQSLVRRDGEHLVYENAKPGPGGTGPLLLTPLQLLDRVAALVPPPRVHRHRYYGVLAPNAPLRPAVTAMALPAATAPPPAAPNLSAAATALGERRSARYAWALLLARIYEVLPLLGS